MKMRDWKGRLQINRSSWRVMRMKYSLTEKSAEVLYPKQIAMSITKYDNLTY